MTDINLWTLVVGLVGAFIGASGAVVAQIVSAHFNAKREVARLDFERARYERDTANRTRDLVFESKRLAFVRTLRLVEEMRQLLIKGVLQGSDERKAHSSLFAIEKEQWWASWRDSRAEVSLLDSLLKNDMELLQKLMIAYNEDLNDAGIYTGLEPIKELDEAFDRLREAMQQSLGVGQA